MKEAMKTFLFLSLFFALSLGARFQAEITENDPNIVGTMTGTMFYDDVNKWIKIIYNTPGAYSGQVVDITNYNNNRDGYVHYMKCGAVCDAESISWDLPVFTSSDNLGGSTITVDGKTCYEKTVGNSGNIRSVYKLWTSGGLPCKAQFGGSPSREITFTNVRAPTIPNWANEISGCPAKVCNIQMEIIFVLDESGSISSSDWSLEKNFANSIIDQFVIGPNAVRAGVTTFANYARTPVPIANIEKNSLKNQISNIGQANGGTCIPCGLRAGTADLLRANRGNVYKLMIVITDGANNVETNRLTTDSDAAKAQFNLVLAIGVGGAPQDSQLRIVASPTSATHPQTVFRSNSFSELQRIVPTLTDLTCTDLPGNPCGAGCKGFCGCKGSAQFRSCICPSTCEDGNFCTVETCSPSVNSAGCTYPSRICDDNNRCSVDSCNSAQSRCDYIDQDPDTFCDDSNVCTTPSCDPIAGCTFVQIDCNDNDACTTDTCHPISGCQHTPVGNCDQCTRFGNPVVCQQSHCFRNECNPTNGKCESSPIVCNDNSECTSDSCDPSDGNCVFTPITCDDNNLCTENECDKDSGCHYSPKNVTALCNDFNLCTVDSCDPLIGCVYTPVDCNDADNCTDDFCNLNPDHPSLDVGECFHLPKKCETDKYIIAKLGNCYTAQCNTTIASGLSEQGLLVEVSGDSGCFILQIENTTVDRCGCCVGSDCFCGNIAPPSDDSYVVGGFLLAAIILAVLGVVGIIALLGGKKGYDVYLRNRGVMSGANTNPLYNANGMSGTNPMYAQE